MFWIFMLFSGLAFVFVKLGMLAVWVAVLAGGLQVALLVIALMTIVLLWRKVFGKKIHSSDSN